MTSLHRVVDATKKLLVGFVIGIILLLVIVFVVNFFKQLNEKLHPAPPTPPTVAFGKLPPIDFPTPAAPTQNFTYTLNTVSGNLPDLPDKETVYKIVQPQPSLLAFQKVQEIATKNNFLSNPITISDSVYQWQSSTQPPAKFTIDSLTNHFTIRSNYFADDTILSAIELPDEQAAIQAAQDYFANFTDFPPDDIDVGSAKTTLYTIENGSLKPATSLSTAQLIGVDFFQKDIDKLPIYYPYYPHSTIRALVGSAKATQQIVEADYLYNKVSLDDHATYPIKTAKQAFDDLKNGKGYIANYDGKDTNITILNVYPAYYVGQNLEQFLLPIIVFQGENNFYGFVSAITDAWVNK